MPGAAAAIFALQAALMAVDEFRFHRGRGLPRWERVGHPLDTLGVLLCFGWIWLMPRAPAGITGYAILAGLSCVLVTKDEWVHARACGPAEHWLHAMLFVTHPLMLIAAASLWSRVHEPESWARAVFLAQWLLSLAFFMYQWIYWNLLWKESSLPPRK